MGKGTFFTGQPIFSQLLNLVPKKMVSHISQDCKADHYCKKFTTYNHLATLLYSIYNHCSSLREVSTGLLAWEQRIAHLGMRYHPRRSTISDAGKRRSEVVFEKIYLSLLNRYQDFLPDSRSKNSSGKLYIFDSTTISLFQEVLKGSGLSKMDGRRKGGIKVHTLIRSDQDVPTMIRFSSGAASDSQFLKYLQLPSGSVIVFDRGYYDYQAYNRFTDDRITWVTRRRSRSVYTVTHTRDIDEKQREQGVQNDQEVLLGHQHQKDAIQVKARLITYTDPQTKARFEFLSNNLRLHAITICDYYRKRWQIELFFKRIKQNYPLKYFLGDSENAIKIQIWCALIADLLLKVIKKGAHCKWSFSNLASMVRLHLMTYTDLKMFLRSAEKSLLEKIRYKTAAQTIHSLFPT